MGTLYDRPNGPVSGGASVANQTAINVAAALAGPLPALQSLISTAETLILSPENLAVALSIAMPLNTQTEQTPFTLSASGYIKTTASGTITIDLYEGLVIASGNLLKTSGAVTQNSATAACG